MKYKAGDVVRVRRDLKEGNQSDTSYVNHRMAAMRGSVTEIAKIVGNDKYGWYRLTIDDGDWQWLDSMLEPVESAIEQRPSEEPSWRVWVVLMFSFGVFALFWWVYGYSDGRDQVARTLVNRVAGCPGISVLSVEDGNWMTTCYTKVHPEDFETE